MADHSFKGRVAKSFGTVLEDGPVASAAVCVSPSDDLVIVAHGENMTVWKKNGEEYGVLNGHRSAVTCCSITNDVLATGSANGIIHLWKYKDLKRIAQIGLPVAPITACALSWSGSKIAVAYGEKKGRIFTIGEGARHHHKEFAGHTGGMTVIKFCGMSEENLLTAGKDGKVKLWNASTGDIVNEIVIPEEGPVLQAEYLDASRIAVLTEQGGLSVFNLDTNERQYQVPGRLKLLAAGTATSAVVMVNTMDALFCYNVAQQKESVRKGTTHEGPILAAAITPSGKQFVTSDANGKSFLWE